MVANKASIDTIVGMAEVSEQELLPSFGEGTVINSKVSDDSYALDWKGNERKITKVTYKVNHDEAAKVKYFATMGVTAEEAGTKAFTVPTSVTLKEELETLKKPICFKYSDIAMYLDDIYGYYSNEIDDKGIETITYVTFKEGLMLDYVYIVNGVVNTNLHVSPEYPEPVI